MFSQECDRKTVARSAIALLAIAALGILLAGCSGQGSTSSRPPASSRSVENSAPQQSSPGEQDSVPEDSAPAPEPTPEPPVETQPTTPADPTDDVYQEGAIEVRFRPGVSEEQARAVIAAHDCAISYISTQYAPNQDHIGVILILPEGKDEDEAVQEFLGEEIVEWAARVGINKAQ